MPLLRLLGVPPVTILLRSALSNRLPAFGESSAVPVGLLPCLLWRLRGITCAVPTLDPLGVKEVIIGPPRGCCYSTSIDYALNDLLLFDALEPTGL